MTENNELSRTRRRAGGAWPLGVGALLLVLSAQDRVSAGAEPAIPATVQATLAVRILEYDRGLKVWAGPAVTIGIVAKSKNGGEDLSRALSGLDAHGVPIKIVQHSYKDAETLRAWIEQNAVRLVYVDSDVGNDASAVFSVAQRLPTLVVTRDQFERGATMGLVVKDGKPHILVNLSAARAARMDLDPKLLQLSEVVR
jgi:hypothetical protein